MYDISKLPSELASRPFTTADAQQHGLNPKILKSRQFRQLFRGVYARPCIELTLYVWIHAALLILPADAALSHASAMRWHGVPIGSWWPLQFSTNSATRSKRDGIVVHRRRGKLSPRWYGGVLALGVDRSFVDSATQYTVIQLIQAGDALLHLEKTTRDNLVNYANTVHLDGVRKARLALTFVCDGVESPMETVVRLMLVFARLPKPTPNKYIYDEFGRFVARCDLVFETQRVIVEYDGLWHRKSRAQRQRDRHRIAALERLGWTVVVLTAEDMVETRAIVRRVYRELVKNGYEGPGPRLNIMWQKWFGAMPRPDLVP